MCITPDKKERCPCIGINPSTDAVDLTVFRNKFENVGVECSKQLLNVTNYVCPNDRFENLEAIRVERARLDFANNFVTGQGPVTVDRNGKKESVHVGNLGEYLNKCKEGVARRNQD